MKQINIYRTGEDVPAWGARLEAPTAWIAAQVAANSWGLPERVVVDPEWQFDPENPKEEPPTVTLPAEYRIEIIDLPDGYDYREKRAAAYPPLTALADALVHQSMGDNGEALASYLSACAQVKEQYPKPE